MTMKLELNSSWGLFLASILNIDSLTSNALQVYVNHFPWIIQIVDMFLPKM